jgi:hypothetical protein
MGFSDYERFKWETMEHLCHRTGLGGPWYEVERLTDERAEQAALVRRLVLELLEEGLIFGTYATYQVAYDRKWSEFTQVSNDVVVQELEAPTHVAPVEGDLDEVEWFWIFPTLKGERAVLSQPAEAFFHEYSAEDIEKRRALIASLDADW